MRIFLTVIFSLALVTADHRNLFDFRSFGMQTQEPHEELEPKPCGKCKCASRPKGDWPGVKPKRLPRPEVTEPICRQEQRELRELRNQRNPRELSVGDEVTLIMASGERPGCHTRGSGRQKR